MSEKKRKNTIVNSIEQQKVLLKNIQHFDNMMHRYNSMHYTQLENAKRNLEVFYTPLINASQQYSQLNDSATKAISSAIVELSNRLQPQIYELSSKASAVFGQSLLNAFTAANIDGNREKFMSSATVFMQSFADYVSRFEETKNNPDSYWNMSLYKEKLKSFYWSMPYLIDNEELLEIISHAESEEEFDAFMVEIFDKERLSGLFEELIDTLEQQQDLILKQTIFAFENEKYALANMGLVALIDNSLSFLLKNKSDTNRKGILDPILNEYNNTPIDEIDEGSLILLTILSNNIDMIFQNLRFGKENITTEKKVRRHTSQHGYSFSNSKIDSIMLFNTLHNVIQLKINLRDFEGKIVYKKTGTNKNKTFQYYHKEEEL